MANTGARVVELEGHQPGGMFGRTATDPGRVQWTVEQETSRVLAHDSPFVERTKVKRGKSKAARGAGVGEGYTLNRLQPAGWCFDFF